MRRWLLILMVALLPLRGWVGEAMAGQMLAQQLSTSTAAAQEGHAPDCHGSTPALEPTPETCASCTQCLACAALIATPRSAGMTAAAPQGPPLLGDVPFASVPAPLLLKPPIA